MMFEDDFRFRTTTELSICFSFWNTNLRLFPPDPVGPACPTGWNATQDKCYLLTGDHKTWSRANAYCESLSGHTVGGEISYPSLLTVESATETTRFVALAESSDDFWLNCITDSQRRPTCSTSRGGVGTSPSYISKWNQTIETFGKRRQMTYHLNVSKWCFHILPSVLFFQAKFMHKHSSS